MIFGYEVTLKQLIAYATTASSPAATEKALKAEKEVHKQSFFPKI